MECNVEWDSSIVSTAYALHYGPTPLLEKYDSASAPRPSRPPVRAKHMISRSNGGPSPSFQYTCWIMDKILKQRPSITALRESGITFDDNPNRQQTSNITTECLSAKHNSGTCFCKGKKLDEHATYQMKSYADPTMLLSSLDANHVDWSLTVGYLHTILDDQLVAPLDIMYLVFSFYHVNYRVIRGNALCIVKPNERLFTTEKFGWQTCSCMRLTKPLNSGIAEFEIECVKGQERSCSIGIVSKCDLKMGKADDIWLFDDERCGDSYQLYLTPYLPMMSDAVNATFQFSNGIEQNMENVDKDKHDSLMPGQRAKFVLDFDRSEITFFVDGVKIGKSMQVEKDMTYYAAFAWSTCNDTGATYKLCSTHTFP